MKNLQTLIGKWVTYTPTGEKGKVKYVCEERQVAFVVYKCNNNWDLDHWKDYTAQSTNLIDLEWKD